MTIKKVTAKAVKLKSIKNVNRFSVSHLVVFVLIFASIGSFLVYKGYAYLAGDPPTAPSSLTASVVNSTEIQISWHASISEDASTLSYIIYRSTNGGSVSWSASTTALTYYNTGLSPGTTYKYYIVAHDYFGYSPASNTVSITTPYSAPPAPTGLTASAVSASEIDLKWNATPNTTGYMIFRNTGQINTTTSTSYHDTGLAASTTYSYYVRAYYQSAVYASGDSNTVSATTLAPPPPPVSSPTLYAQAASPSEIDLNWTASSSPGGVDGYDIYRNSVLIASTDAALDTRTYKDTGLSASTTYSYYVTAYSVYGTSNPSNTVSITTPTPPPPPTAPTDLSAETLDDEEIDLSWTASTSAVGINRYNIYRNGSYIGSTSSTTSSDTGSSTAYYDSGLASATTYSYFVVAINNSGIASSSSTSVSAMTQSTTPPSAPTSFKATVTSSSTVQLSWAASVKGQVGIKEYDIYEVTPPDATDDNGQLDGNQIGSTTGTTYSVTGLSASTDYGFYVIAVDITDNFSDQSAEALATTNVLGYTLSVGLSASVTDIGNSTTGTVINTAISGSYTSCTKKFDSDGSAIDTSWSGSFSGISGYSQTVYPPSGSTFYTFYSYELSCTNGVTTAVSGIAVRKFSDDASF